jgi:hypothetical protein
MTFFCRNFTPIGFQDMCLRKSMFAKVFIHVCLSQMMQQGSWTLDLVISAQASTRRTNGVARQAHDWIPHLAEANRSDFLRLSLLDHVHIGNIRSRDAEASAYPKVMTAGRGPTSPSAYASNPGTCLGLLLVKASVHAAVLFAL